MNEHRFLDQLGYAPVTYASIFYSVMNLHRLHVTSLRNNVDDDADRSLQKRLYNFKIDVEVAVKTCKTVKFSRTLFIIAVCGSW